MAPGDTALLASVTSWHQGIPKVVWPERWSPWACLTARTRPRSYGYPAAAPTPPRIRPRVLGARNSATGDEDSTAPASAKEPRTTHHGAHDCLMHVARPKRPPPIRRVESVQMARLNGSQRDALRKLQLRDKWWLLARHTIRADSHRMSTADNCDADLAGHDGTTKGNSGLEVAGAL